MEPVTPTSESVAPTPAPVPAPTSTPVSTPTLYAPASIWRRLSNHILDAIFSSIFVIIATVIASLILPPAGIFLGWLLYAGYFIVCEHVWQKTPAKFITKTKVVMHDGSRAPFKNVFGRSFARIIPFEPFSFLFNKYPRGWHDSLSGTIVVPDSYTAEDIRKIDYQLIKKEHGVHALGFVIIICFAVLFFIAITGILSSVVLVSLNVAREKGADARAKATVSQLRLIAEVSYGQNNTYDMADTCASWAGTSGESAQLQTILSEFPANKELSCVLDGRGYAISTTLGRNDESYLEKDLLSFCLDSTGTTMNNGLAIKTPTGAKCVPVPMQ
jgi:uncharacterized RDD family membrane protein YckC